MKWQENRRTAPAQRRLLGWTQITADGPVQMHRRLEPFPSALETPQHAKLFLAGAHLRFQIPQGRADLWNGLLSLREPPQASFADPYQGFECLHPEMQTGLFG